MISTGKKNNYVISGETVVGLLLLVDWWSLFLVAGKDKVEGAMAHKHRGSYNQYVPVFKVSSPSSFRDIYFVVIKLSL